MSSAMRRSMVGAGPSIRLLLSVAAKDASSCAGLGLITRHLHGAPVAAYLASPAGVWSEHRSGLQSLLQGGFAARAYAAAAGGDAGKQASKEARQEALTAAEEEFSSITDKIPQRPVTIVEGTSYTLVIVAALGFAAAVLYAAVNELLLQPKEYKCYNLTLDRIKDDPRITVRLGTPISSYGTESRNRAARQRIPNRVYNDTEGREHVQIQFHMRGPSGRATVSADMYQEGSEWRYNFLYVNVESPVPQQVVLIRPGDPTYAY